MHLHFFGENKGAREIISLRSREQQGYQVQWDLAFKKMRSMNWIPIKYEDRLAEKTKKVSIY